ncbi:MAG TPA: EI24 domain-containing protein [Myxococcota bacterium]|nr:EI24 domain-containing protein [Myxococcota bacterium]
MSWAAPRVLRRAALMLRRERSLWPWIAVPFALNLAAFAAAASLFFAHLGALAEPLQRWLEVPTPSHWWGYLVAGPLWLLAALVKLFLIAAFGVALYFGFTLLGGVIAAPFLDVLSERVERLAAERPFEAPRGARAALRRSLRAVVAEGQRFAFFLAVEGLLLAAGLVPGLQPFAAAAGLGFAALFLPLAYTGFALDRREVSFAARRRWLTSHSLEMLSFGGFALVLFAVPGLSFVCLPWLVAAGTLLVLELGPPNRR